LTLPFSKLVIPALGLTQPRIQWVPGVKRLWYDTDLLPPSSSEVKNEWRYTSTTF
jgi:hypothetical protein